MAFGGGPPANRPPHCPPCSPARCASQLSFSIDRILAPDFGRTTAHKAATRPAFILRSPKRSEYDDRNSGIVDSECSKSLFDGDTRNLVEKTPGYISPPLFGTSSISLDDPVFDTISVGVRNDIHNTSPANCCIQDIHERPAHSANQVSVMIPEENHKTHQLLTSWMPPNSASITSQSPANDCSIPHENKKLREQYRSRSAHEAFQQEISPLSDHVTPGSPQNVKRLMPKTLRDSCAVMASSEDSEKAAACKSGSSRSPTSSDAVKAQERSAEPPPAHYTPSSRNAETRTADNATVSSNSDLPQASGCSPGNKSLKVKLLKVPTASDANRLCRSLSPSTLRSIEDSFGSEIPNNRSIANAADSSQNNDSQQQEISIDSDKPVTWPAWVYCTRYSDRPSSGPRSRRKNRLSSQGDEKRSRTAFTGTQLSRLRQEFQENRYLTEQTRLQLAKELRLTESQVKIWFQNKRAKLKKSTGQKNPLALQLMAQGLYRHSVQGDPKEK